MCIKKEYSFFSFFSTRAQRMASPIVELAEKQYNAIINIITAPAGSITIISGPPGSGKTTVMNYAGKIIEYITGGRDGNPPFGPIGIEIMRRLDEKGFRWIYPGGFSMEENVVASALSWAQAKNSAKVCFDTNNTCSY